MIGQFSAFFLRMYGCKVVVCDIDANRLDEAKKAGAAAVVNLADSDAEERLLRLGHGGFDIVVEASGSIPGITLAHKLLRRKPQNYSKDYKVDPIRFYGKDWPRLIVQATTWLLLCCPQISVNAVRFWRLRPFRRRSL